MTTLCMVRIAQSLSLSLSDIPQALALRPFSGFIVKKAELMNSRGCHVLKPKLKRMDPWYRTPKKNSSSCGISTCFTLVRLLLDF